MTRSCKSLFIILIHAWMRLPGLCEDICSPVAELHTTEKIKAEVNETTATELKSYMWQEPSGDKSVLLCKSNEYSCDSLRPGYTGTSNVTTSVLIIINVTRSDTGGWTLLHTESTLRVDVCHLVTAQKPQCTINSDVDSNDLDPGDELTLTVNVTRYYCSQNATFSLSTGDVTQILLQNQTDDTGKDVYDEILNTTFDINLARFGDVILEFGCESRTWSLICGGVQKLRKSQPQCNISSDNDTSALDLVDELTLTVDIRGYYCPRPAGFNLTTGHVTETLLESHDVYNVTDAVRIVTFNITTARFGDVKLRYSCDGDTWVLACGGVTALVQRQPSTTEGPPTTPTDKQDGSSTSHVSLTTSAETSPSFTPDTATTLAPGLPIPLIAGVSGGLFLFLVLLVIVIANRRQLQRVAQKYIVQRRKIPSRPYIEDEIPAGYGPEVPKDGKADDMKLGSMEQTIENHADSDDKKKKETHEE